MPEKFVKENPLITTAAGFGEDTAHFFIKDKDHPYVQDKPFDWIRGYQVGGKSLIWGRACPRWSHYDFTAPARYGYGIEWPISYEEIAPGTPTSNSSPASAATRTVWKQCPTANTSLPSNSPASKNTSNRRSANTTPTVS
ncbi:hypothetical protein ACQ86N_34945 [Puia sp. P3]|uniref:hypothetical protein n=1 Tax=Puia sp. P3 TaxID=3423952 RepID=UPI003D66EBC6